MTINDSHVKNAVPPRLTPGQLIERLRRFQGPPHQFLPNLLAEQCRLAEASAGAILSTGEQQPRLLAVWPEPEGEEAPAWLASLPELAREATEEQGPVVRPLQDSTDLYDQPARRNMIVIPLRGANEQMRGVAAYLVETDDPQRLAVSRERLELTSGLLDLYEMRLSLEASQGKLSRLRGAMEVLASVNEHNRFHAAAMALCNEVAARFAAERVSLGFLKGRYVHVLAMSHTEKFSRKQQLVQDVESAMEESLDQDLEVLYPAPVEAAVVNRTAQTLSQKHGGACVLTLPVRVEGEPAAALTVERPSDRPFTLAEAEALRLTCDLCTAQITSLREHDRWFGARAASKARKGLAAVLGPRHTWAKLIVLAVIAAVLALALIKGDYTVAGDFVTQPRKRRVIAAPFDGFLKPAPEDVRPGRKVREGEVILEMNTAKLQPDLVQLRAEAAQYEGEAMKAMDAGDTAQRDIARAKKRQVEARIRRIEQKLADAQIRAPVDGVILQGDLRAEGESPKKTGDALLEIAPAGLRAELQVPEDRIAEVEVGSTGEVLAAARPSEPIPFVVEWISPMGEPVEGENVFRVRVKLERVPDWMNPGMEGLGRVYVDRRPYGYIWTRRLVNWIRMKLW